MPSSILKRLLFFLFTGMSIWNSGAQQTFDIITYNSPQGWKKENSESVIQFTKQDEAKGRYCIITLMKSIPGTENSKQNFDAAWETVVKEMVKVSIAPEMQPSSKEDGWEAQSGFAPFERDGEKGIALLVTSTGYQKMVNILILTNTNAYETEMSAFLESVSFKKITPVANQPTITRVNPMATNTVAKKDGYAFSTTNFDDGWNATINDNWVKVEKGATAVLLHFGFTLTDNLRTDITNNCFYKVAINRYKIIKTYNYAYSVLKDFTYYFLQADAIDKITGKNVFISFQIIPKNGVAYCYEIITPSKNEFQQQFSTMDKIEAMAGYNRFAIGPNDLIGTWQEGGGAFTQYYFVSNGNYAGMDIVVGNIKYIFTDRVNYKTDVKVVRNTVYATEKETGSYNVTNWELITKNQNQKVSGFNAWFEATKGGRILHMVNKKYTSEHYQLGKER
jgi:hypothetical protein